MATTRLEQSIHPTEIEQLATQFAGRTQRFQKQQLQRQIRAAFGVDVPASDARIPTMIEHFVGQNVALIKAIPTEMSMRLDKSVTAAFTTGQRHEDLAREIESRFDIGERHARLIARDQIGKLAGQVNAARQQSIGITHFVWRTVGDERVREEHDELDGETFGYEDPPDEGLPGEPICCRCSAEPVFDDILGDLDSDD